MRGLIVGIILVIGMLAIGSAVIDGSRALATPAPCLSPLPVPDQLVLPARVPAGDPVAIEQTMLGYLASYQYRNLGWCLDKGVRDTGPYVNGISYGTHRSVRIYYSPQVIAWLEAGQHGFPPDGSVIIKEQYTPPSPLYAGLDDTQLRPGDWTVMIRRANASHDGWFWAEVWVGMFDRHTPTRYQNAGFGLYCLRCHASAVKAYTFAALENVEGFHGDPMSYHLDDSWRAVKEAIAPLQPDVAESSAPLPASIQTFPPEPLDTMLAHPHGRALFLTSDQCMGCHSGVPKLPLGPLMWAKGKNISEYGEWRWSPMALAGRDPVFHAQFETELETILQQPASPKRDALVRQATNTCTACHGAMGNRTFASAHPTGMFPVESFFQGSDAASDFHAGGLARDGISCSLCHHIVAPKLQPGSAALPYFLEHYDNGAFATGPADKIFGPYKDNVIATYPMQNAIDVKPVYSSYTESSQLCGSCHVIDLPVVDAPALAPKQSVEQATYVEWLNSAYEDEYAPGPRAQSCQACHMPSAGKQTIAMVQDDSYPRSVGVKPLVLRQHDDYRRHELLGLNAFLLTMFQQYPGELGVRLDDYASGTTSGLPNAIGNIVEQAQNATARIRVVRTAVNGRSLVADVEVVNLTGHRFPTGVSFRRAFVDFEVRDTSLPAGRDLLFASGRTDSRGNIVGVDGRPLANPYQEHFDEAHPLTSSNQAQVFEELVQDARDRYTVSFLHRDHVVKDNRILPLGWSAQPRLSIPAHFLEATFPEGGAASDPRYADGKGHAIVRYVVALPPGVKPANLAISAHLYYQSWAPSFIRERSAGSGPAAQRFAALVSGMRLENTALKHWKLLVTQTQTKVH